MEIRYERMCKCYKNSWYSNLFMKIEKYQIYNGGEDSSVTLFNIEGLEPLLSISEHTEPIEWIYESPFTGDIISGSQDKLFKMFNMDIGNCINILEGHKNTI